LPISRPTEQRPFEPCLRLDVSDPMFLTLNEVVERHRGQISEGTLRDWRSMRIGASFIKIGKASPLGEAPE
jgi:hypothetical protein